MGGYNVAINFELVQKTYENKLTIKYAGSPHALLIKGAFCTHSLFSISATEKAA